MVSRALVIVFVRIPSIFCRKPEFCEYRRWWIVIVALSAFKGLLLGESVAKESSVSVSNVTRHHIHVRGLWRPRHHRARNATRLCGALRVRTPSCRSKPPCGCSISTASASGRAASSCWAEVDFPDVMPPSVRRSSRFRTMAELSTSFWASIFFLRPAIPPPLLCCIYSLCAVRRWHVGRQQQSKALRKWMPPIAACYEILHLRVSRARAIEVIRRTGLLSLVQRCSFFSRLE